VKNSCRKGKVGELQAVKALKGWGFPDAERSQQYSGAGDDSDVVCRETLPNLHIEVKRVEKMALGNGLLYEACNQAVRDAKGKPWVVLWRPNRAKWHATADWNGLVATVAGDKEIPELLARLNQSN
jgi:hypothetical protein